MTAGWSRASAVRWRQLREWAGRDRLGGGCFQLDAGPAVPGGLYCGSVHATATTPISPTGLCAASQYGSTLLKIPAAGTENDDLNPPRVAPRNLFDVAVGHDNLFGGDRYKWSARLTVVNLTNKEALYNFLSTFSGTHYVTPRAITATLDSTFRRGEVLGLTR